MIPALVMNADTEDSMIMGLVENLARRQHRPNDLLRYIQGLKMRGYEEPANSGLNLRMSHLKIERDRVGFIVDHKLATVVCRCIKLQNPMISTRCI